MGKTKICQMKPAIKSKAKKQKGSKNKASFKYSESDALSIDNVVTLAEMDGLLAQTANYISQPLTSTNS